MKNVHKLAPSLALALVVGCGSEDDSEYGTVASGLSSIVADPDSGDPQTFSDLVIAARGEAPTGLTLAGGHWTGLRDQLDFDFEVHCTDASGGTRCEPAGSADIKVKWRGKVEKARYKLEIERDGDWTTTSLDADRVHIVGMVRLKVKSDFKDHSEDLRHKFDFDATTQYDVIAEKAEGVIQSGTASIDLHAKEKSDDGTENIKSDIKMKVDAVFTDGEVELKFDGRVKYRVKLDSGELELMSE